MEPTDDELIRRFRLGGESRAFEELIAIELATPLKESADPETKRERTTSKDDEWDHTRDEVRGGGTLAGLRRSTRNDESSFRRRSSSPWPP